ncbi:MAG: threonine synthase [Candidatus Altimarinota bacterium]
MYTLKKHAHARVLRFQLVDSRGFVEKEDLPQAVYKSQPQSGGGLYTMSEGDFPKFNTEYLAGMANLDYRALAKVILSSFDWGISRDELAAIIDEAYGEQWSKPSGNDWYSKDTTPVKHIGEGLYSLHLGYGPTMAFKNVALEFLPRFLDAIIEKLTRRGTKAKVHHVLGASSGDTINAAHFGVKGTENIKSIFMLPERDARTGKGPSEVQALQATHGLMNNPNALTLLVDVPFDPAQDVIKALNGEGFSSFKQEYGITSFNSINIARILAQTVYYFRAYTELIKQGVITSGEEVVFSVPSGNFGDALAGMYAKYMGLPIKIHVATNENDVLDEFIKTGRYAPREEQKVFISNAPSQDIAKSSNLERAIFLACGGDQAKINQWYNVDLKNKGYFEVDAETRRNIQSIFSSSKSTNEQRLGTIQEFLDLYGHPIETHTATAATPTIDGTLADHQRAGTPIVILETSHHAQFRRELSDSGIILPEDGEFQATIDAMRKAEPEEGVHYLRLNLKDLSPEARIEKVRRAVETAATDIFPKRNVN